MVYIIIILLNAFKKYFETPLKVTDALCEEVLTIPLFPEMNESEILRVEEVLQEIFSANENLVIK
jgi:dTDP-4-amino-4,6-dideoxygalactose transaminase